MATLYKTKRYDKTDEIHIFKGEKTSSIIGSICVLEKESLCTAVNDSPVAVNCKEEQEMREHCAKLGRSVCANCVGELYKTLED